MADSPPEVTVRTVTVFLPDDACRTTALPALIARAASQANRAKAALLAAGVPVQTTRLAVSSPAIFGPPEAALRAARLLDASAADYASLGTVRPADAAFHDPSFFARLFDTTQTVFISVTIAASSAIHPAQASLAARVVVDAAPFDAGMRAFRFAALAHVRPECPFFPAAYAGPITRSSAFLPASLGVQAGPLARRAARSATPPLAARALVDAVESTARRLVDACAPVCSVTLDYSLAPFPDDAGSTARALADAANVKRFGQPGTIAGAAVMAAALQNAKFPRGGLNGLMLPVAEDVGITVTSVPELLLCSAVCGTGLDTVPLPGDVRFETVRGVLLDLAALSCRLGGKQLTARLVPVPGLKAGDTTRFTSEYMCNGPVLSVTEVESGMGVGGEDVLRIEPLGR